VLHRSLPDRVDTEPTAVASEVRSPLLSPKQPSNAVSGTSGMCQKETSKDSSDTQRTRCFTHERLRAALLFRQSSLGEVGHLALQDARIAIKVTLAPLSLRETWIKFQRLLHCGFGMVHAI
jgi:hypothetical protein